MRIISKFSDYYDGVLAYGQDSDLVYVRDSKEINLGLAHELKGEFKRVVESFVSLNYCTNRAELFLIGIAGYVYYCYRVGDKYCFSSDEIIRTLEETPDEVHDRSYNLNYSEILKRYFSNEKSYMGRRYFTKAEIENSPPTKCDSIFLEVDAPVFVIKQNKHREYILVTNPLLKSFEAQKLKDPFTIHQEIAVYLGNTMVKSIEVPESETDVEKRDRHGFFDSSFKQTAPSKKEKRAENKRRKHGN